MCHEEGMCIQGAPAHHYNIRCQPVWLGCPSTVPDAPGKVVSSESNKQYKLAGAPAVPLALRRLQEAIADRHILILTDNVATMPTSITNIVRKKSFPIKLGYYLCFIFI